jgi:hypothetical protein
MMELLGPRTNAAQRTEVREKVTDSWRWNRVAKKSHATFVQTSLEPQPAADATKATVHPLKLCRGIADNGSERAWRESGFFILAML